MSFVDTLWILVQVRHISSCLQRLIKTTHATLNVTMFARKQPKRVFVWLTSRDHTRASCQNTAAALMETLSPILT